MRRTELLRVFGLLFLAAGVLACQAQPIPLSAQKGSTIIVPLSSDGFATFGYGGTEYTDGQRGTMVYRLEGTGTELTTRFSVGVPAHRASSMAQNGDSNTEPIQIFSVVDLVASAGPEVQEGTYNLEVVRRVGQDEFPHPDGQYGGQIQILSGEGTPNPNSVLDCGPTSCSNWPIAYTTILPRPRIELDLWPPGGPNGTPIAAFELDLSYPQAEIDVVDAMQSVRSEYPPNALSTVWLDDDDSGTAKISAIPHPEGGGTAVWRLEVVFELIDDAVPLDLSAGTVQVSNLKAYDIDGQQIAGVAVQSMSIH